MATVLESGLLQNFSLIFSMVLVMAIVYGLLEVTKTLGENKALHGLIAFIIGMLLLVSPNVTKVISALVPWFTLMFVAIILILMTYKLFGATEKDFSAALKGDKTIIWTIIIIAIIIIVGVFSQVYGQQVLPITTKTNVSGSGTAVSSGTATTSFSHNVGATFFHPKVLGLLLIFLVAVFTVAILASQTQPPAK